MRRLLAATILVLGGAGLAWGVRAVSTSDLFRVRRVSVGGTRRVPPERILALAFEGVPGSPTGTPIFSIDLASIRRRIEGEPWVASADVERDPPDRLVLEVRERLPRAVLASGGMFLLDDDGVPFKAWDPAEGLDLPVVTGLRPDEALAGGAESIAAAFEILREAERDRPLGGRRISEVHLDRWAGATLLFEAGGPEVRLGLGDPVERWRGAERLLRALGTRAADVDRIVLLGGDRASVHLRGGRVERTLVDRTRGKRKVG